MSRTPTQLVAEAGRLLFGQFWMNPLAGRLGISSRTVQRLAEAERDGEEFKSAAFFLGEIAVLLEERRAELSLLRAAVETEASSYPPRAPRQRSGS